MASWKIINLIALMMAHVYAEEGVETVTGTFYVNNNFTFYINGELIAQDPVVTLPHNAYSVNFTIPRNQDVTYGITGIDWADVNTGLEFNDQCLGSGVLRAVFSNGVVTNSSWKCWTSLYGPVNWQTCYATDDRNGSVKVLPLCNQQDVPPFTGCRTYSREVPQDWNLPTFDDSNWESSIEFDETMTIWGLRPAGCEVPNTVVSSELDPNGDNMTCPEWVDWGTSRFIWREDLALDNTIHCRYTVKVATGGASVLASLSTTAILLITFSCNMIF